MVLIILCKKNKCSISDVHSITPSIFKVNKKKNKCLKNKKGCCKPVVTTS